MSHRFGRLTILTVLAFVVALLATVAPASAQTAIVRGKIVDGKGQAVEGAQVVIEAANGRKFESKTNPRGEYTQILTLSGAYKVTASKQGVGTVTQQVNVRLGQPVELNLSLAPAAAADGGAGEFAKLFEAGVNASTAGDQDGAVAKFQEALKLNAQCYQCEFNIGASLAAKKDNEGAEAAYKRTIALKADYAPAYNALANLYNQLRKFEEAAQMSAEAAKLGGGGAGGGDPDSMYNQGVIMWNAGKIADAKKQFQDVVAAKADHADAHYWLGMANLNEGNMPGAVTEFDEYMKLAPTGQYAAQAKGILSQIKK